MIYIQRSKIIASDQTYHWNEDTKLKIDERQVTHKCIHLGGFIWRCFSVSLSVTTMRPVYLRRYMCDPSPRLSFISFLGPEWSFFHREFSCIVYSKCMAAGEDTCAQRNMMPFAAESCFGHRHIAVNTYTSSPFTILRNHNEMNDVALAVVYVMPLRAAQISLSDGCLFCPCPCGFMWRSKEFHAKPQLSSETETKKKSKSVSSFVYKCDDSQTLTQTTFSSRRHIRQTVCLANTPYL